MTHRGDFLLLAPKLRTETFDLVIADPPYWKVLGEAWDYEWRTKDDYFAWSARWLDETTRVLRLGGTIFVFGYFRMLARLSLLLEERGFLVRQEILVDKGKRAIAGRATRGYQLWPNTSESILFAVRNSRPFIAQMLRARQQELGLTARQMNNALGVKANGGGMWSILTADNVCGQVPTREMWGKLQETLSFDLAYERVAPTFNAALGATSIWTDFDFYAEKRIHPAQKPLPLIERLITSCSNPGDRILDPFAGSGQTGIAAQRLERCAVLFEKDAAMYTKMETRIACLT